ncbi:NitT/TauT family transport system substrate-binding protein [Amycolatopsis lexingtonensis]|uniref:NitT/TauT family transport system substrate-binding protein n=1 Tax=Amycolatopsis lexingtonensis TaxID=218822 RepID=A0ABR9I894_9PSEU|nr:ABC transporter substrate-binding protein [Amycolatopsis lexingtonensis]MBE1499395.1 NitT/TauT family transport system substrate-binding protein [Amycolatopsis lexingtonensis]
MRIRRIAVAVTALTVVAGLTTACQDSRTAATGEGGKPKVTIMVGGLEKVIYLPAMLTQQLGNFAAQGIDVELQSEQSGANAETALVAGQVQGVVGFYDHTIDLQAKDQCIKSVVQLANIPGEALVVGTAHVDQIKSSADFKGKKMGVTSLGSSTDFLTKALAAKANVGADQYTPVKVGAGQTFIASLDNGGIEGGMTTDPTIAQLTNTGKAKVLYDLRTAESTKAALGGLYPASSLYMSCDFVDRNKDAVQKLANAFVATLKWIGQHSPEEIAAKMPPSYSGGDKALYIKSIKDSIGMFNGDGKMDAAGAKNVLEVLSSFSKNVQPKKDSIDLSKTYTTEFVDAAAKQG